MTILTQLDKIILSKMLSLEMFGYYTLAGIVSVSLYRLIGPGLFCRVSAVDRASSVSDHDELKKFYHKSCQLMSVFVLPVAIVAAMFSYEILFLWTRNAVTADKCHLLVSMLVCGTALNGFMNIPYALQLAHGWTTLAMYVNWVSVILLAPMIFFLTNHFGAVGGPVAWVVLNSGYFLVVIPIMHRRLLVHEKWRWYGQDVGIPLVASFLTAGAGKWLLGGFTPGHTPIIYLIVISVSTLAITVMTTPVTREWLLVKLDITQFWHSRDDSVNGRSSKWTKYDLS